MPTQWIRDEVLAALSRAGRKCSRRAATAVGTRFVIADITDAKSVLQELQAVVPNNPSVPVQPLLLTSQKESGMFDFFRQFPWVLKEHVYASSQQLVADLGERVIDPAEAKVRELRGVTPDAAPSPLA